MIVSKVSNNELITIFQSLNLIYRFLNLETFSVVIKTAIDVNRAELLGITMLSLGFNNDIIKEVVAERDLVKFSLMINGFLF